MGIRDTGSASRVAQLAEQVAVNHPVGGSNPSPGARLYYPLLQRSLTVGSGFEELDIYRGTVNGQEVGNFFRGEKMSVPVRCAKLFARRCTSNPRRNRSPFRVASVSNLAPSSGPILDSAQSVGFIRKIKGNQSDTERPKG